MGDFIIISGYLLALYLSTYGWGLLVNRYCYSSDNNPHAFLVVLGLSLLVAIGGIFNVIRIISPLTLNLLLVVGLVSTIAHLFRLFKPDASTNTPHAIKAGNSETARSWPEAVGDLLPHILVLSATAFYMVTLLPAGAFNHHDDFYKYLPRVVQILQAGTLGDNPYGYVGLDSFGIQSFLQAFIVANYPLVYVNGFEIFCFLVAGLLLNELGRRVALHWLFRSLLILFFILFNPQYVNISALYSGRLMILALIYSSMLYLHSVQEQNQRKIISSAIPIAMFVSVLVGLKYTLAPFAAIYFVLFFCLVFLCLRPVKNTILSALTASFISILFLAPWFTTSFEKYLVFYRMAMGKAAKMAPSASSFEVTTAQVDTPSFLAELFSSYNLYYGGNMFDYNFLLLCIIFMVIYAVYLLFRKKNTPDGYLIVAITVGIAAAAGYFINAGFARFPDVGTRYSCPFLIVAFISLIILVGSSSHFSKYSLQQGSLPSPAISIFLVTVLGVSLGMFADLWWLRSQKILEARSMLSYPLDKDYLQYQAFIFGGKERNRVKIIQEKTDPGSTLLAWISTPFYLDHGRNRVLKVATAAEFVLPAKRNSDATEGWLAKEIERQGIQYILWEHQGVKRAYSAHTHPLTQALIEYQKDKDILHDDHGRILFRVADQ